VAVEEMSNGRRERRAEAGELCTCGRPAVVVFVTERFGETGWCGTNDGGAKGPCWFCGDGVGHDGLRCRRYRLRVELPIEQTADREQR
jgi:hypothetical protein